MGLFVRGLSKRGSVWWARVVVPADVRRVVGKTELLKCLGTGDDAEAVRLGTPIIAKFKQRIADARGQVYAPPAQDDRLTAGLVWSRLAAWERRTIRDAEAAYINDGIAPLSWSDKARRSDFLYALAQPDAAITVQGFSDRMAEALRVPSNHPALDHKQFQFCFRQAWQKVERAKDRFAGGDFSETEDDGQEAAEETQSVVLVGVAPAKGKGPGKGGITLDGLLDAFLRHEKPPEARDIKRAWRLFTDFVGDRRPADITPAIGADFLAKLREFPNTRKPEIEKLSFLEAIAAWNGGKIAPKTVWKIFGHIRRVFAYGVKMELIHKDPLVLVKNKKPTRRDRVKKRDAYDQAEIRLMFSRPMFAGFSGKAHRGYREKSGDQVVKDAKFWLPILALWHGGRQDEFASTRLSEIKERHSIAYFDWKRRDLKTEESARELPIHPIMRDIGWNKYIADLREKGEEYLFPELAHDQEHPKKAADRFSKWFGLWQEKNGFTSKDFDFHAFRHTFKRACRDAGLSEEVHDLLTGHASSSSVGRDYGAGADIKTLAEALAKVNFPTFPLAAYNALMERQHKRRILDNTSLM